MNKTIQFFMACMMILASHVLHGVDPILISNASASGGIITLAVAGNYQAIEDLIYPVVISTNGVCFNINRHRISCDAALNPIVSINSNLTEIALFNGRLKTSGLSGVGTGLLVNQGVSNVSAHDLKIYSCGTGVKCAGQSGNEIATSEFLDIECVKTITGIALEYTDNTIVKKCTAAQSAAAGFSLFNSDVNMIVACQSLTTTGTLAVCGFVSQGGTNNLFMSCVAKRVQTTSTNTSDSACGFLMGEAEQKTKLLGCIVNDVLATDKSVSYGVNLLKPALLTSGFLNWGSGGGATGIPWLASCAISPDGKFLAQCWNHNIVGTVNLAISSVTANGDLGARIYTLELPTPPCSVAWSPDGKYLAFSQVDYVNVCPFDGCQLDVLHAATYTSPSNENTWGLAWSPNGKYLAFSSSGAVRDWCGVYILNYDGSALTLNNYYDTTLYHKANGSQFDPVTISWHPDGTAILVSGIDHVLGSGARDTLKVLQIDASGKIIGVVEKPFIGGVYPFRAAFSPCGRYIAAVGYTYHNAFMIWGWDGSNFSGATPLADVGPINYASSLAWSPEGRYIAVGCQKFGAVDPFIQVFEMVSPTSVVSRGYSSAIVVADSCEEIYALAWSPDGRWIAAADFDTNGAAGSTVRTAYAMVPGASNCLVDNCKVCDVQNNGTRMGIGYAGAQSNIFTNNLSGNNSVNYTYGIPNVYDGRFEQARATVQPFDNISCPTVL